MFRMFINECIGALVQLLLFSLIPLIFWLVFARKKQNFLNWLGVKKIHHEGKGLVTACAIVLVTGMYIGLTIVSIKLLCAEVTTAGSDFAGKGFAAFPAVLAYGFIRTGLSEEIVFRGFILKRIGEKIGFFAGDTIQAVLFGMAHGIPFGFATHSISVAIVTTLLPGVFAWFLGWMNEKWLHGSIIASWLLHGTINTIVATLSL